MGLLTTDRNNLIENAPFAAGGSASSGPITSGTVREPNPPAWKVGFASIITSPITPGGGIQDIINNDAFDFDFQPFFADPTTGGVVGTREDSTILPQYEPWWRTLGKDLGIIEKTEDERKADKLAGFGSPALNLSVPDFGVGDNISKLTTLAVVVVIGLALTRS